MALIGRSSSARISVAYNRRPMTKRTPAQRDAERRAEARRRARLVAQGRVPEDGEVEGDARVEVDRRAALRAINVHIKTTFLLQPYLISKHPYIVCAWEATWCYFVAAGSALRRGNFEAGVVISRFR